MTTGSGQSRYTGVAIALHWVIALLILLNLVLGLRMVSLTGLSKFNLIQLHKSVGITVLVLSVARLGWRLTHPAPPWPPGLTRLERAAASAAHWGFYGLMLGLPLTGWIMVSASATNIPTLLFKTVPWPHIGPIHDLAAPVRKSVEGAADLAHISLTYAAYALIALHLGAVVKHQAFDREDALYRITALRWRRPGGVRR